MTGSDPIAYLQISELVGSTPHELRKVAQRLESDGIKAVILDLRSVWSPSDHTALLLASLGNGSKLVVADAFGGRLALVDTTRRTIESVRTIPAHNIRGMAFTPDGQSLVIAHQRLDHLAQTTFDDVHWGLLIRNVADSLSDTVSVEVTDLVSFLKAL